MTRYNRAQSEEQVVDLQWSIMKTTNEIGDFLTVGQLQAAVTKVDYLETLLYAYIDEKYKADVKSIESSLDVGAQNTDIARRAASKRRAYDKIKLKHRALMSLAMRCGFMPLKKTGMGGMTDVHR